MMGPMDRSALTIAETSPILERWRSCSNRLRRGWSGNCTLTLTDVSLCLTTLRSDVSEQLSCATMLSAAWLAVSCLVAKFDEWPGRQLTHSSLVP